MVAVDCGWCRVRCNMSAHGTHSYVTEPVSPERVQFRIDQAYICDGCGRMSFASWGAPRNPDYSLEGSGPDDEDSFDVSWWPPASHQKQFLDVPEPIAETAVEAWSCFTAGSFRGAMVLARAVVESTADTKGAGDKTLYKKIDWLGKQGFIRPAVVAQTHEIRHFGNSAAHGDLDVRVEKEEAEEILELMGEVLNEVFQAPAKAARLEARRSNKLALEEEPF